MLPRPVLPPEPWFRPLLAQDSGAPSVAATSTDGVLGPVELDTEVDQAGGRDATMGGRRITFAGASASTNMSAAHFPCCLGVSAQQRQTAGQLGGTFLWPAVPALSEAGLLKPGHQSAVRFWWDLLILMPRHLHLSVQMA